MISDDSREADMRMASSSEEDLRRNRGLENGGLTVSALLNYIEISLNRELRF